MFGDFDLPPPTICVDASFKSTREGLGVYPPVLSFFPKQQFCFPGFHVELAE